jgi:hypothetical protein
VCGVTLIVAVVRPDAIWLLADRRLSYPHRPPRDDARKIMFLETTDGVAILGYTGLGETIGGTEPADWMNAVLRGRNLPLEKSLGVLARAMREQLPRHLLRMPRTDTVAHHVILPAFVGEERRLYSIDLVLAADRKGYRYRYTRHVICKPQVSASRPPWVAIAGSGGFVLMRDPAWMRRLLRVVRAHERGAASPRTVAKHLAKLNSDVAATDQTVGPRCIVGWRFRRDGVHKGGGAQEFYTGLERDGNSSSLPQIGSGMDVAAIAKVMIPFARKQFEAMDAGGPVPEFDKDEINAALARVPHKPDEKLD